MIQVLQEDFVMRFDLTDEKWSVIEPLLPKSSRGPKRVDDRRVLNSLFNILRTGAPWRDLQKRYQKPSQEVNISVGVPAVAVSSW